MNDAPPTNEQPSALGSVLFELWMLQQALYPLIEHTIRPTGLSAEEFGLYLLITDLQPVTPGEIAYQAGMRANTVSTALQRLEKRGHIVRVPNEQDRRSVYISLSESGSALTGDAIDMNQVLLDRLATMIDTHSVSAAIEELSRAVRVLANMPSRGT